MFSSGYDFQERHKDVVSLKSSWRVFWSASSFPSNAEAIMLQMKKTHQQETTLSWVRQRNQCKQIHCQRAICVCVWCISKSCFTTNDKAAEIKELYRDNKTVNWNGTESLQITAIDKVDHWDYAVILLQSTGPPRVWSAMGNRNHSLTVELYSST